MRLADAGKIDIDQPLRTYIPEFTIKTRYPGAGPITIRSILTHHSGLPESFLRDEMSPAPEPFTSVINELKNEYVSYPPNYIYAYSNIGISLLGIVIERVAGQKFADYMEAEIFKPLAMEHSSYILREDMKPYFAQSYSRGELVEEPLIRDLPTGSVYSSVNEMSNFIKMSFANGSFQDRNILKKETMNEMITPQNNNIPLDLGNRIGLAWHLYDHTGKLGHAGKIVWHNGGTLVYHSSMITLPESKLGVIVLTNSDSGAILVDDLAADILRLALEAKTGLKAPKVKPNYLPEKTMTASEMKQYEGYYATTMGLLAIQPKGKTWRARCQGKDYQLLYHEGRWFSIPKLLGNIYLRFTRISGLPVVIAKPAICESEAAVIGEALFIEPLPEIWRKRCGKYRVVNDPFLSDVKIDLLIQDNILLFRTDDSEYPKMPLTPLSDNMAVTRGLGRKAHQTVRFEKMNGKEGIIFSGLKLEKI